jgi:hypothetical protein
VGNRGILKRKGKSITQKNAPLPLSDRIFPGRGSRVRHIAHPKPLDFLGYGVQIYDFSAKVQALKRGKTFTAFRSWRSQNLLSALIPWKQ